MSGKVLQVALFGYPISIRRPIFVSSHLGFIVYCCSYCSFYSFV